LPTLRDLMRGHGADAVRVESAGSRARFHSSRDERPALGGPFYGCFCADVADCGSCEGHGCWVGEEDGGFAKFCSAHLGSPPLRRWVFPPENLICSPHLPRDARTAARTLVLRMDAGSRSVVTGSHLRRTCAVHSSRDARTWVRGALRSRGLMVHRSFVT
jgi:hypothetical protein